jgi:hypothetical protein
MDAGYAAQTPQWTALKQRILFALWQPARTGELVGDLLFPDARTKLGTTYEAQLSPLPHDQISSKVCDAGAWRFVRRGAAWLDR